MGYLTQNTIANNGFMFGRISQAAAEEGLASPEGWTSDNRRIWAASPGWDDAWESAIVSHPDDPEYDPGADEAVITDGMILAQVQAMNPQPEEVTE